MKKVSLLLAGCALLALATAAQAQLIYLGQMGALGPTAKSGLELVNGYLGFSPSALGGTAQLRFAPGNPMFDVGVAAGFGKVKDGGPSAIGGGVDAKIAAVEPSKGVKIGGQVGLDFSHETDVTNFGGSIVPGVSYTGESGPEQSYNLYGGLGVLIEHSSVTTSTILGSASASSTNSSGLFRVGGGYNFTKQIGAEAEYSHAFASWGRHSFLIGLNLNLAK